jgi:hypothetical protein
MFPTKNVVIWGAVLHFQTNTCDNFKLKTTVIILDVKRIVHQFQEKPSTKISIELVVKNTHVPIYSTCKLLRFFFNTNLSLFFRGFLVVQLERAQVMGTHFFSPANVMQLLENVRTSRWER